MIHNNGNNGYGNGVMTSASPTTTSLSPSSASANGQSTQQQQQGLKTYFKTQKEGTSSIPRRLTLLVFFLIPMANQFLRRIDFFFLGGRGGGDVIFQITLAHLKEKPTQAGSASSSGASTSGGVVRNAAARLLGVGGGNGSRALSFVGGNGTSKAANGTSRSSSLAGSNGTHSLLNSNYDGKGTYLIFNVGDSLFVSDLNTHDKDPIKSLHFSTSNPICHSFDPEAKDGHDLLIGLNSGDVYSVSLRQQLQDVGKKLVGAQHYNKEGSVTNRQDEFHFYFGSFSHSLFVILSHTHSMPMLKFMLYIGRCTSVAWVPKADGAFVVAHADGNLYVYEKASLNFIQCAYSWPAFTSKDGTGDTTFPVVKDQNQFSVAHARSSKSNPIARWHICQSSINGIAFSTDGAYLATVGRDGYLRVFDYQKEQLICGGKSYYGALLCCAWRSVEWLLTRIGHHQHQMAQKKVSCTGLVLLVRLQIHLHAGVIVSDKKGQKCQDTQLLLWDLSMDEIVVPLRRCPPGGSPTFSTGSQSSHWDSICPAGTLQPAPSMRDVPKLSPLVAHRVHSEPLSGLIFTEESILTACREGYVKIWVRPSNSESQSSNPEIPVGNSSKEIPPVPGKTGATSYKSVHL
ncbi:putative catabolite repression protein crec [Quercus suber]|uniref:Catabolite repression protein crec n=1 Tax=Quercus suber TaxID=58331 RepID=A0AAW0LL53_QUESU